MPRPLLDLDLPAVPESAPAARKAVSEALRDVAVDHHAVLLMVSEAVTNCAVHAYPEGEAPGRVRVHAEIVEEALDVVVSDDGIGIASHPESDGLGLGVLLMDDLSDGVQVDAATGTRITARFELFGAAGPHGRQVPRRAFRGRARRRLTRLVRLGRR
ncbi:ATP-binding protein [Solirubrobacter phytolaccae]|uniref:ATP-binding protein n=1 Tax=Solirubrobacter phytolaccae TaxID=1404360 RepID=A0A9X3NJL3_9ACTN|nr:ATP-binding protein [Solirubrobacter phytolaccae]MDA0184721.1 ATP-binding protein [Solirubrobacter phytolaccae]